MTSRRMDYGRLRASRPVLRGEHWLERRAGGRPGSLVLGCVLRYTESSEHSAEALVLGAFLSVVPALLAVYALSDLSAGSGNSRAQHLIYRLHIHAPAARLVSSAFGSETSNAAAASVIGLLGFVIFGLGLGKIVQRVYAQAWRIEVRSLADRPGRPPSLPARNRHTPPDDVAAGQPPGLDQPGGSRLALRVVLWSQRSA